MRKVPILLMTIAISLVFSCKDKKPPEVNPEDAIIAKLVNGGTSWKVSSVTLDNENRTADFTATSFTLTLTENKTYSTSGVPALYAAVWPISGSWDFNSGAPDPLASILRDGTIVISIDVLTSSSFVFSFTYVTGSIEGTTSTEGNYVFSMIP